MQDQVNSSQGGTSTDRVRNYRARQKAISMNAMSHDAKVAMAVVSALDSEEGGRHSTEKAIISRAKRLCSCERRACELVNFGKLTREIADLWIAFLHSLKQCARRMTTAAPVSAQF